MEGKLGEGKEITPQQNLRLLIIEDDPLIAMLLRMTFKPDSSIEPEFLESGEHALERLREEKEKGSPFNMVITDLGLTDGREAGYVVAQATKDEKLAARLILLTGSAREVTRSHTPDALKEKGIDAVWGKPFSPKTAIDEIKRIKQEIQEQDSQS